VLDFMTPDARYHVFAWEEPFVGREAIREELLRQAPHYGDGEYEFQNVASVTRPLVSHARGDGEVDAAVGVRRRRRG
jgi:hypothetical protein